MEKKTVYLSQTTKSPYVPRYLHGEASDPQCASFSNLVTMLKHDFMRGEVYDYDVVLDGGTYYLSAPIRFGSDFRGKVTVKAKAGEKVILSGGRQITDFTETVVNGISCLSADIPAVRLGEWYFEELYVNKEPRFRPVLPKDGKKYRITDVPGHPADDFGNTDVTFFRAEDGAFDGISHVEDTTVEILHYWLSERMTVRGYDKETKTVYTDRLPRRPLIDDTCPKYAQYRVINVFEALNRPGEWYLDREKGKLYYIPLPGETKDNILVEAPVLRNLLEITGTPEEKIGGIHFENVIF
ncbi:MAG: hypothetical protein MJ078_05100, partial [Clostridia bacterium]|nr:hypothetical protein [Clostridia bacterium]